MEEIVIELVVIEEYAIAGKEVPLAKTYRLRIDKETYDTDNPLPTGKQILGLAKKEPAEWKLYQIIRGQQPKPIAPDQHVDLREKGVERFTTVPKDPTEGLVANENTFLMPEADRDFLDSLGKDWQAIKEGETRYLLIHGWGIPPGYNTNLVTLLLVIPSNYPDTQIDMAYFSPSLKRLDGGTIANLSDCNYLGKQFQQWSRHRTAANPWRPGVDDIASHLSLVDDWLRREFK
ncbi:MAG: hypothetical protein GC165_01110 [Armatimonadetes bacterium]|nr:hypothetical protein [Armatimonadota bacterium]